MTAIRRERLAQEITRTTEGFLQALQGVPPARWSYTTGPGVWSVAETAEHTAGVLRNVQRLLDAKLLASPLPEGARAPMGDEVVVQVMVNRERRYQAPEFTRPGGRWTTPEALTEVVVDARQRLLAWLDSTTADLRGYGVSHPLMGMLDGVQWVIFAAAHTERHTRQILEFRRQAGF